MNIGDTAAADPLPILIGKLLLQVLDFCLFSFFSTSSDDADVLIKTVVIERTALVIQSTSILLSTGR